MGNLTDNTMKYIDAEKLKAELDKDYQRYSNRYMETRAPYTKGLIDAIDLAEQAINSLQQEQPEVDLEKFISDFIDKKDSENQGKWCEEDIIEAMKSSFALGLNARKI